MPRKKPPGTAVDKRNGERATLTPGSVAGAVARFSAPPDLCPEANEAWNDFWDDRPSLLLTPSSRIVLIRWINAVDRYVTKLAEADERPIVFGSTGQETVNPLYKIAEQAKATMEACEKQLGIGGLNAAALGIAAIQEKKSLQELSRSISINDDEDDDFDPRTM